MSIEVWGNMPKGQDDPETIEEAIARLIQAHENDANAHVDAGESLHSHKAAEIIDHVAGSIISDKLEEWIGVKATGDLRRDDIHWLTFFEALDGFYTYEEEDGTVYLDALGRFVMVSTGATINGVAGLRKELLYVYQTLLTWDKDREFRTEIYLAGATEQEIWIIMGEVETARHVGFKIIDDTLYGTVADGTTESTLDCGEVDPVSTINLRATLEAGVKATFYRDGVNKGTIATNLPTGSAHETMKVIGLRITNTEAVTKYFMLSMWDFWQAT